MKVSMCKMCKEPLWSFICSDCIAADLRSFLPARIAKDFGSFYKAFYVGFNSSGDTSFDTCLHCHAEKESSVCTFCFVNEICSWMKLRDGKLRSFMFHFEHEKFSSSLFNDRWIPISRFMCDQRLEGLCEACGEYWEELACSDGRWVCADCIQNAAQDAA